MKLCGGIDLHANNSVVPLSDESDRVVYRQRLPNDAEVILAALAPDREEIEGLVEESTGITVTANVTLPDEGHSGYCHRNTAASAMYLTSSRSQRPERNSRACSCVPGDDADVLGANALSTPSMRRGRHGCVLARWSIVGADDAECPRTRPSSTRPRLR
jgi:hypothetical protein